MDLLLLGISLILVALAGTLITWNLKLKRRVKELAGRFAGILDVEKEIEEVTEQKNQIERSWNELQASYKEKRSLFDRLVAEAAIYDGKSS